MKNKFRKFYQLFWCQTFLRQHGKSCLQNLIFFKILALAKWFLFFFHLCTHTLTCVHTNKPTILPAVTARVNMSIVWPAHQALIPECLQAAEGKELKVSVCKAFTLTHTFAGH